MADKIKSFFQKKIKDEKFKHAGKGYKLTESHASVPTTSKIDNAPKRHEPTNEARVAGQAALARLEGMKTNTPKLNTSFAAIQARAKRELQEERLANQISDKSLNEKSGHSMKLSQETNMLAVSGVYYRCPLISDEVLNKEQWFNRMQEFFSAQLLDDESGLSACLIIHNCNDGTEGVFYCVETLCKYLNNIISDPSETKYWKIRISNKIFQEKIEQIRGAREFLKAAGFIKEKLLHQDKEEDFLVWNPSRSSIDNLSTLVDALRSAEVVQLQLDRNIQVLLPKQAAERSELPDEFFILSIDDLKREQFERTKALERNQQLMTQAMRNKFTKDKDTTYRFTVIRIRFPDNIILQGTFLATEKYKAVVEFVQENLLNDEIPFYLITATREKLIESDFEKSLEAINLVPAVVLTFFWDTSIHSETPSQYLKEETLSLLQSL